jgi:hypothetical protein
LVPAISVGDLIDVSRHLPDAEGAGSGDNRSSTVP